MPKLYIILFDSIVVVLISALYCSNRFWLKNVVNIPILSYLLTCYFPDYLAGIGILTQIFPHGTSDKWDVVSYVLGGVSYIEFFRGYQYRQMLRTVCELPSNI